MVGIDCTFSIWLVVWNVCFSFFFHIVGTIIPVTFIFFSGVDHQPAMFSVSMGFPPRSKRSWWRWHTSKPPCWRCVCGAPVMDAAVGLPGDWPKMNVAISGFFQWFHRISWDFNDDVIRFHGMIMVFSDMNGVFSVVIFSWDFVGWWLLSYGMSSVVIWLVVKNMFYFPFHIWDVIRNPLTNYFIFFKMVLLHHQAVLIDHTWDSIGIWNRNLYGIMGWQHDSHHDNRGYVST